jgi:hypothetical protein
MVSDNGGAEFILSAGVLAGVEGSGWNIDERIRREVTFTDLAARSFDSGGVPPALRIKFMRSG